MDIKDLKKLIADADVGVLQETISEWLNGHDDFRKHVKSKLCPVIEEIDFGHELSRKAKRETKVFLHGNNSAREATDWSNVYYGLVQPWDEQAETFPTETLYQLTAGIITEVGMKITEEDFHGDDWYGDDFSGSIGDIMETLGNIAGLLLVREDVSEGILADLEELVKRAKKTDIIDDYIGRVPYNDILEMIKIHREADEVTSGMYDVMIEADYLHQAGKWLCRQIDFIRNMDMPEEARNIMEAHLDYPEVCLKKYDELMAEENWKAALELLDEAQKNKGIRRMPYFSRTPNWLKMKQDLLAKYGSSAQQN